mmetsp:Transcript_1522/g.2412  ORF Transcript_1522/g.2412 Transcript_1522/m.2412 type:complete len:551 (+) Transcript_1522:81-1733(+)|eukprot:CAMPEP_0195301046 /NCGR_PEP_ID=MMETSP0707-20130614/28655_1 /TAXON_ID=33640 /ORGANISM="Asterionellopsis glacialis, Strain CCMP134" /LENGTH=550 /DNA_ID=CAMNT_0040363893 /DNA_START=61 /DNA_END=1713 /DNA_ORIENTATION=+
MTNQKRKSSMLWLTLHALSVARIYAYTSSNPSSMGNSRACTSRLFRRISPASPSPITNSSPLSRRTQTSSTSSSSSTETASSKSPITRAHLKDLLRWEEEMVKDKDNGDDDDDDSSRWLRWMTGGTPSGKSHQDLLMREPVELGGIARADRYASRDWFHNTLNLPSSAILRDIRSPVLSITSWAFFISLLHSSVLHKSGPLAASRFCLPSGPHSLMVSTLGLLLVFKTNSAYQRFKEGRQIWEKIINASRDLSRMIVLYENEIGIKKRKRIQNLLAAFPYLLRHRIRPDLVMRRLDDANYQRDPENTILLYRDAAAIDNDLEAATVAQIEEETGKSRRKTRPLYWVDKRTLPWRLLPPGALEKCARAQNRPLWVADRMAQELRQVPDGPNFTARERLTLIGSVSKLSEAIGACERIHQTVVPLNYARHSLRSLTIWLLSLPFALVKELGLLTGPVLFVISWLLFGVYEIGYSIEDPFQGTLRLSILCDTIRRDVLGDEDIRNTAFELDHEVVDTSETKMTISENIEEDDDADYEDIPLVKGENVTETAFR